MIIRRSPTALMIFYFWLCNFFILQVVYADGSFSHAIPYGEEECLLIRVPKDQPYIISGSFDLLDSKIPSDPVHVALYNSDEQRVWASNYGDSDGSFSNKGMGKHWLCLENGMTYENPNPHPRLKVTRTIGFAFRVKKSISGSMAKILGEENMKNDVDGTTERLLDLSDDLNDNFDVLMDHMSFMKARELVHRELHEETFTKVVRWNILEIVVVVIVTFGQVLNVWWILSRRKNTSNYY